MSNQYQTVKLPKGLIAKIREVVDEDDSYLNVSDYVRYAVRKMLNDLNEAREAFNENFSKNLKKTLTKNEVD